MDPAECTTPIGYTGPTQKVVLCSEVDIEIALAKLYTLFRIQR